VLNCELAQTTVHGYSNGELDAVRSVEFERHLENCAECQAALEGIESLRTLLQQSNLYEHPSPQFRERVRKQLALVTVGTSAPVAAARRWFLPAFAVLAAAAVFLIAFFVIQPHVQSARVTAELVDAHVRSLQP